MPEQTEKPRILWITRNCLVDNTSGASLSAREMLRQLVSRGAEVEILGATVFDAGSGSPEIQEGLAQAEEPGTIVKLGDGELQHTLVKTASPRIGEMSFRELDKLFILYRSCLNKWNPHLVWFYGGQFFEFLLAAEAKRLGVSTAAFLVNGNYTDMRWSEDVDLILTDSQATAGHYKEKLDLTLKPVGKFIRKETVVAAEHSRTHVTFINPGPEKGGHLVAQIALAFETRRPDIQFEVVEGRSKWNVVLSRVSAALGEPRESLSNVTLTPNTTDMRPIYGRSRIVLSPSLWWESGNRVLVESMFNGIPAIVTNRGGPPEMIGRGGITISLPESYHAKPYSRLLSDDALETVLQRIERLYDDEDYYRLLASEAIKAGQTLHDIERNTDRLVAELAPLLPAFPEN